MKKVSIESVQVAFFQLSKILNVDVQYFYSDYENTEPVTGFAEDDAGSDFMAVLNTPEGMQLCKYFHEIRDPKVKRRVLDLVKTLAGDGALEH